MKARITCQAVLWAAALARPVAAQLAATMDVGVRDAPVNGFGSRSLWAVAPALRYDAAAFRLRADAEYRDYGRLGRGVGGGANASYFFRLDRSLRGELTGSARGVDGGPGAAARHWDAGGRLHFGGGTNGVWLGSQAGRGSEGPSLRWEAALWRRLGHLSLQVEGSQLTVMGRVLRDDVAQDTLTPRPDTLYRDQARISTDVAAWLRWNPARAEVAMAIGRRYGLAEVAGLIAGGRASDGGLGSRQPNSGRATTSTWWLLEGTYWLAPRWGITGSVGRRPADSQLRTPGGRFPQLALRTTLSGGGRPAHTLTAATQTGLRSRRLSATLVELRLPVQEGQRVELRGDFSDWRPIAMELRGEVWQLRCAIAPGVHLLSMRVDDGPWLPPPGVPVRTDDYGEATGVLTIE